MVFVIPRKFQDRSSSCATTTYTDFQFIMYWLCATTDSL